MSAGDDTMRKIVLIAVAAMWMMAGTSSAQVTGSSTVPGVGNVSITHGFARSFVPPCQPSVPYPLDRPLATPYVYYIIVESDFANVQSLNWEVRVTWHDGQVDTQRGVYRLTPNSDRFCLHNTYTFLPRTGSNFSVYINGTHVAQMNIVPPR